MSKTPDEKIKEWPREINDRTGEPIDEENKRREYKKITVILAEPYNFGAMHSLGNADNMLLRQFNFPYEYDERDTMIGTYHDRIQQQEYEHCQECFGKYIPADSSFERWLRSTSNTRVLSFLKDMLKADPAVNWTGYRVTRSVHGSNGNPIYYFALFAKHPETDTRVYSDFIAPNVKTSDIKGFRIKF